jgi:hypothetical protein
MMLFRVPVGKMFHRGAPMLLRSGASVVPCRQNGSDRLVFESYPALVARRLIGRRPYKSDERKRRTPERERARRDLVFGLSTEEIPATYGISVEMEEPLRERFIQEPAADALDSLLCAVQAAWAYGRRGYGAPLDCDIDEGWIPDPVLL